MSKRMLVAAVVVLATLAVVGWWKALSRTVNADQSGRPSMEEKSQSSENEQSRIAQQKTQSRIAEEDEREMVEFLHTAGPPISMTGVTVMPVFLIKGIVTGSPAQTVGLREGDLIANIDGHQADSFKVMLRTTRKEPGTPVTMDTLRYNTDSGKYDHYKSTMPLAPWQQQ